MMARPLALILLNLATAGFALVTQSKTSPSSSEKPAMSDAFVQQWVDDCAVKRSETMDDEDSGPCFLEDEDEAPAAMLAAESHQVWDGMTAKADMTCTEQARPSSEHDFLVGPGRAECRYEPPMEELEHYRLNPEDIAIVMPTWSAKDMDTEETDKHRPLGILADVRLAWRLYAKTHNYTVYLGKPDKRHEAIEETCPEVFQRTGHWMKACVTRDLLFDHKYLLVVDKDTMVLRPHLRLEPLFAMAGLLNESSGKVMAVAKEWGSCKQGVRCPISGDVNSGVILLKQTNLTHDMMEHWWYDPMDCRDGVDPFAEDFARPLSLARRPYPYRSFCTGCGCLDKVRGQWPYDQLAFFVSIVNRTEYQDNITIFKSGCPFNSPFADFIGHFVSSSPTHKTWNVYDRPAVIGGLWMCMKRLLRHNISRSNNTIYDRCSICDALPSMIRNHHWMGAWSLSCPGNAPQMSIPQPM